MKIAIIGAGNVGTSLGSGWLKSGHHIIYGVRNPSDEKAAKLKTSSSAVEAASNADAARAADVVVFSTPWAATEASVRDCGSLSGKTVIDATNPLKSDLHLDRGFTTSGAEQVAQWAKGAEVFKTMNQIGFGLMDHPVFQGDAKPVMFVAGDGAGKSKVVQLVSDLGFEAIDLGGLEYARLLEPYALIWIHLSVFRNQGRDFAFSLLRQKNTPH